MSKYLANSITVSRFLFSGLLLLSKPLSPWFWVWYACGGLSDLLDGPVARQLKQTSALGAKLDSAADFVFIACAAIAIFRSVVFPVWALFGVGVIALLRFVSYGVGYRKFHTFAAVHTLLNKATGLLLFLFPVLFALLGVNAACAVLCAVALLAAVEELLIVARSDTLDRDRKSLLP
jgi:CDP-diacylglycerol---glycerol-3-phosphate 3-phosphatidyltransferase